MVAVIRPAEPVRRKVDRLAFNRHEAAESASGAA
jgi:hypothetical protein